ncbi:MAG: hypothetical protein ACE361_19460 [Aureliella sp.]
MRIGSDWVYVGDAQPVGRHLSCHRNDLPEELRPAIRAAFLGGYKVRVLYRGEESSREVDVQRDEDGAWDLAFV